MRFRLGLVTGFAAGYYLGSRAGRQRYDQINRTLSKVKRSPAFEQAADQVKTVVEEGVEKARTLIETRAGNGHGYGPEDASSVIVTDETAATPPAGFAPPPAPPPPPATTAPTATDPIGGSGLPDDLTITPPGDGPSGPKGLGGYSSSR